MDITKSKEWHEARRLGIGGSDVAAVLNLPPYGCARRLWYEKRATKQDFETVINPAMQRGIYLEDIVREIYREQTHNQVKEIPATASKEHPFMLSNVDGVISKFIQGEGPVRNKGILEIKCPGREMYSRIKRNGIPEGYLLQGAHYMYVDECDWMEYAIFCADFWELLVVPVERDDELIKMIIEAEENFWKHVENGPIIDRLDTGDTRCRKCVFRLTCWGELWEDNGGEWIESGSDYEDIKPAEEEKFVKAFDDYTDAKEMVTQAETVKEDAKQDMIEVITREGCEGRERLLCSGGKTSYKWEAKTYLDREKLEVKYPGAIKECSYKDGSLVLRTYPKKKG